MTKQELKPCPFCGGVSVEQYKSPYGGYFVRCLNCGAEVGNPDNQDWADEAWNTRPPIVVCDMAEKSGGLCCGYQKSEYDDEPIEQCQNCDKYFGKDAFEQ